ncbi:FAD-binding oxidoreductase [bacterium]|nr:FAD-binding oxidoreductase [bacterium]
MSHRVRAERPRTTGRESAPAISTERDALATYEEDAARSRGNAAGVARPASESEVAALVRLASREGRSLMPQGARSSLTAGATPRGDIVLSTEKLDRILEVRRSGGSASVVVEPGVRLRDLNEHLAPGGLWFPPVPTYDLCCAGGAVSTNAAGAATFKHGPVRPWVLALRAVLASGDVLALRRGEVLASPAGFEVLGTDGSVATVPLPRYRTPALKKIACGYHVRDGLDLVDLFVGSEGTLGVVTEIELGLAPLPACVVTGLASFPSERAALAFTASVREASETTWRSRDPAGVDVRAIEFIDSASLSLLKERGKQEPGIAFPSDGGCFVLWEQELPEALDDDLAASALGAGLSGKESSGRSAALSRLGSLLARHEAGDDVLMALPSDERGRRAIGRVREIVPETVNELVAERKRADPGIKKVAGDMVVPVGRLGEMLSLYREAFSKRGLASAIWGHSSDGNLHPNVLARSERETRSGEEALLELGEVAKRLGGAPLSEHGVGKSPVKQELLRRFYGEEALRDMAAVKRALDPAAVLAPGNIFPRALLGK